MLSAVLRSDVAIQVSIKIMNAFVAMRRFFANNSLMFEQISEIKAKQLEYSKIILKNNSIRELILPDFKTNYIDTVINSVVTEK